MPAVTADPLTLPRLVEPAAATAVDRPITRLTVLWVVPQRAAAAR